jgi:hypothetical protein
MRSASDVQAVFTLLDQGLPLAEISRRTGVSRATIRDWQAKGRHALDRARQNGHGTCRNGILAHPASYAYLLGQYLGDGCISEMPRGVSRLRLACCTAYPNIIEESRAAMRLVVPNRVGSVSLEGCTELYSYWKHWTCAFPQAGRGPKHMRPIVLEPWQRAIAIEQHPEALVRGLLHSDGCRVINRVKRKRAGMPRYEYSRYFFSNRSLDIQRIFTDACDRLLVMWRQDGPWNISVARRESVALLDKWVGAKS